MFKSVQKIIWVISLILSWQPSTFSAETLHLSADEGLHKFPFFDEPTPVWQYNAQTPGPILRAKQGTTLIVEFTNKLKQPTSIHWHGLRIENAMDGVPGVTQPAIEPGDSFTYRLQLNEAGTYWYHPHFNSSEQLERGLKGVLIVEEPEVMPWSREMIWLLDDWRLQKNGTIYPHFNTGHDLMHDGRWGNAPTINGLFRPKFQAVPGERIRLRLINSANARVFAPALNELSADVIAIDGKSVTRIFSYERFNMAPGNRVDLDITIPADAAGKTYVIEDTFTREKFPLAYIEVQTAPAVATPEFSSPTAEDFIPAETFKKTEIGKTWDLNAFRGGKFGIGWGMNQQLWPESDKADFQIGKPKKIAFNNSSSRLHPMHIHGVFFRVLERNGEPAVEPFTRDTVLVGPRESVIIGLVPEHPGIWATHCHILEHAEAGMMTTIEVGNKKKRE
jgi:FtsP/CotA-like multicopper oxidase with cupredoxin domain